MKKNIYNVFMVFFPVMAIVLFAGGEALVAQVSSIQNSYSHDQLIGHTAMGLFDLPWVAYPSPLEFGMLSGFASYGSDWDSASSLYSGGSGVADPLLLSIGRLDMSSFSTEMQKSFSSPYGPIVLYPLLNLYDEANRMTTTSASMSFGQPMRFFAADGTTNLYRDTVPLAPMYGMHGQPQQPLYRDPSNHRIEMRPDAVLPFVDAWIGAVAGTAVGPYTSWLALNPFSIARAQRASFRPPTDPGKFLRDFCEEHPHSVQCSPGTTY